MGDGRWERGEKAKSRKEKCEQRKKTGAGGMERANDEQQITIRSQLFELEDKLPPVDVIFLYKIIDWIGDLADRAQKVGGRLQLLLAR